jgi:hypothetical protein
VVWLFTVTVASTACATSSLAEPEGPARYSLLENYNQALNVLVPHGVSKGGTVSYLGTFAGTEECATACAKHTERCWSFVHMKPASTANKTTTWSLAGQCFAVTSPGFNPSYDTTAVSGIMEWGCRSDEDCSLNGKCSVGTGWCKCRPAWKGSRCEQLNLLPPTRGAGYRGVDNGHNTSSWGGAVLKGSDGLYHMWAAEMTEHCTFVRNPKVPLVLFLPTRVQPVATDPNRGRRFW